MKSELKEIKQVIRDQIKERMERSESLTQDMIRKTAGSLLNTLGRRKGVVLNDESKEEIIASLCNDFLGFGPLENFINDNEITEIMVNGPYKVFVEKKGRKILTSIQFDDEKHLRHIIEKILYPAQRRVDESMPYADASFGNGLRANVIVPPLSADGSALTIRKMTRTIRTVRDLVHLGTIDERMATFLVACVKARINIIFSGATGCGKTTTLSVLSGYINPEERIVTIEDVLELNLRQGHVVRLLSRPQNLQGKGNVSIRQLFENTIRMRPTRIVLGEIRGEEAMDYLQALNSGHRGCLAVIHASSPEDVIMRLETLTLFAGFNVPSFAIRQQIASGLDLIIQQELLADGSRKTTHITEVFASKDQQVILRDLFRYEIESVEDNREKLTGRFVAVNKPTFLNQFEKQGVKIDEEIFIND